MKLYEISNELLQVLNAMADSEDGGDYTDTLEAVQMEWEDKADNVACYIKQIQAEATAIKEEEKRLTERRKRKEKEIENLTEYLYRQMQLVGSKKLETTRNVLQIKKLPASVKLDDGFIDWCKVNHADLLSYSDPTVSKTAVKALLKDGEVIKGARLESVEKLNIK